VAYTTIVFTGIVEATAAVLECTGSCLALARPALFQDLSLGASISVSGVCLTIAGLEADKIQFDVVPETFIRTNLGTLSAGNLVNLERALAASGRFDGHIVQGHVEGVATVISAPAADTDWCLTVTLPPALADYVVAKGSIAIDGVSLTVASIVGTTCTVALVPHTLAETNLHQRQAGDTVNIETDILGRYVRGLLRSQS
jgi:riboflavin synthase